jgi:3',5'-cyclic AMP phosphodiesterase CpdA
MRLAWATDVHLNFVGADEIRQFAARVGELGASALVLSGDIGEAATVVAFLEALATEAGVPIYFVLGNHDFYRGAIRRVRQRVVEACTRRDDLIWLGGRGAVALTPTAGLLGHDGWADGRYGDYDASTVLLNDYLLIDELSGLTKNARRRQLELLGDEAGAYVRQHLPDAAERFAKVLFVTHVPPFVEASWHEGGLSGDLWLPHFACQATGDALLDVARAHPSCDITVLCGHTHGRGVATVLPNLTVRTGGATYGSPAIEELIDL